jgi:hypothetical protein
LIRKITFLISFILLLLLEKVSAGICTSGTSSLINIPVARVLENGHVVLGMSYINKKAAYLSNGEHNNFPVFLGIGYLPRTEISAGVVLVPGRKSYDGTKTYKDAVISFQLLLCNETTWTPSIALGIRDLYSYILLNTSYISASKCFYRNNTTSAFVHWGAGFDIIKHHIGVLPSDQKNPVGHTIIGAFGGLEFNLNNYFSYVIEYDTQKINSGFRFIFNSSIMFEMNLFNMEQLGCEIQTHFRF